MRNNVGDLKTKILKINSYSIYLVVLLSSIISFIVVYFVVTISFRQDVEFTKREYFSAQKSIIKNQVNNFINFIWHTAKIEKRLQIEKLQKNADFLAKILTITPPDRFGYIIDKFQEKNSCIKIGLSDMSGRLVYTTAKDFSSNNRLKVIQKLKGANYIVLDTKEGIKYISGKKFLNQIDHNYYFIANATYQKIIDKSVKKIVLNRVQSIKFGAKNNGYLSIAQLLNYNGGKKFAKVVALPVKPEWVGKYLDDDKKDAKGKMYRKEYLKIVNTTKEGYVSYWFFKKKTKQLKPKISYIKLYKPFDWIVFTSVYLDDVNSIIAQKEKTLKDEIYKILYTHLFVTILFLTIAYFITKYENRVLLKIMNRYENEIHQKNVKLKQLNKNLQKEIDIKTQELFDSYLTDPLTKLANREKLIIDAQNRKYIGLLNIDSFKEINDFYGVEIGDKVLKKVATILRERVGIVYKLSGDEFAILDGDKFNLKRKIESIISFMDRAKIIIDNNEIQISFSSGIGPTLSKADMALKYAKKTRHKNVIMFSENLPIVKEYENNLKWKNIIKFAIEHKNIYTYVQPIFDTTTHKITKYECLIRLKDNDKIYTPYFFLEISKKTGQYQTLQKIVIEKSFSVFSKLDYKFSINLSLLDLNNSAFEEYFLNEIEKYNIQDKLIVELLEDDNLLDTNVIRFLNKLQKLGVEIAIDDFGSGYSNFSYIITKLPVNILKIDGSLIRDIDEDEKIFKLLKNIVNMAKEFDFYIVAEFVENREIATMLEDIKIDYLQGYYISKPFNIEELEKNL